MEPARGRRTVIIAALAAAAVAGAFGIAGKDLLLERQPGCFGSLGRGGDLFAGFFVLGPF